MNSNDIGVFKMVRKYGFKGILMSGDTLISVLTFMVAIYVIPKMPIEDLTSKIELTRAYASMIVGASAGILAIVIAALSIIVSILNDDFLEKIHKSGAYYDFVVPFLLTCIGWISSIIINILIFIITYIDPNKISEYGSIVVFLLSISLAILLSNLKGIVDLMCIAIGLGIYRQKIREES